MDDVEFPEADSKKKTSAKDSTKKIKIISIVALCLVAIGALAYGLGFFGKSAPKIGMKGQAENRQRLEKQVKKEEKIRAKSKAPAIEAGG